MISKEYLKSHLVSLKIQRDAARRQMAIDEAVLKESTFNLYRIEGSLNVVRNLIVAAESNEARENSHATQPS